MQTQRALAELSWEASTRHALCQGMGRRKIGRRMLHRSTARLSDAAHLDEARHRLCEEQEGVGAARGCCKGRDGAQHVKVPHRLLDA